MPMRWIVLRGGPNGWNGRTQHMDVNDQNRIFARDGGLLLDHDVAPTDGKGNFNNAYFQGIQWSNHKYEANGQRETINGQEYEVFQFIETIGSVDQVAH